LNTNNNEKPSLPSSISIFQLLREYLNDDDFAIFNKDEHVFRKERYEEEVEALY
jgi:hypothetical protein